MTITCFQKLHEEFIESSDKMKQMHNIVLQVRNRVRLDLLTYLFC